MPEAPEIRIMSDFINQNSKDFRFKKLFHVEKGNNPIDSNYDQYNVSADFYGKQLKLSFYNRIGESLDISVFMGMSGNWKLVPTVSWFNTKYTRMRLDREDGMSLLLYGGYMGPKYKIGGFNTKRGFDIIKDFDRFKANIISNLSNKVFDKPICETLLDQRYFDGVGNYIRSTILYYMDVNPFESARDIIKNNPDIFDTCRYVIQKSYELNGGQLRDWENPNPNLDSDEFHKWVFYQKGISCVDKTGRTFWFDEKWANMCPYKIKYLLWS
jgi:endonuclease VIII-like 1